MTDRLKSVLACAFAVFLLFYRAHWAFNPGWLADDGCLLSILGSLTAWNHPGACPVVHNYFAPGAPLLWLPAAILGRAIAFVFGTPAESWVVPLVAIESFCLWGFALHQFAACVEESRIPAEARPWPRSPVISGLVLLLCAPVLYYATHRVMMSHTAEIAAASLALVLIARRRWIPAFAACAVATLTRYNDAPIFLLLAGALIDAGALARLRLSAAKLAAVAGAATLVVLLALFQLQYGTTTAADLLANLSWARIPELLFGFDFGLLWTAPWWLGAWVAGIVFVRRLTWTGRAALAWMTVELLLVLAWGGNGGDFGYRYLIGSHVAAFALWIEVLALDRRLSRSFRATAWANAVLLTYLLIVYKTAPGTGAHNPGDGVFNPYFIFKALSALWRAPQVFDVAIHQQLPMVTLALSRWGSANSYFNSLTVEGPGFAVLLAAATLSLVGCACAPLARLRSRKRSPAAPALR